MRTVNIIFWINLSDSRNYHEHKESKNEIKNALKAYLATDEFGAYRIPPIRQRPILLMGPPGIGKTQIMQQIAEETGVGLVSYTLTHHTRQSALGLPFIDKVMLGGEERTVTAYTMSEIIASVYREMERTGVKEGILFLDEINCISETLTPMMLQFLQCKTFGNQQLPAGWVVVAAGNPPEYNKSVREFDVVTLDRVKKSTSKRISACGRSTRTDAASTARFCPISRFAVSISTAWRRLLTACSSSLRAAGRICPS